MPTECGSAPIVANPTSEFKIESADPADADTPEHDSITQLSEIAAVVADEMGTSTCGVEVEQTAERHTVDPMSSAWLAYVVKWMVTTEVNIRLPWTKPLRVV